MDTFISHDKVVPVTNVLRNYNKIKHKKKLYVTYWKQWKPIVSVVNKILRAKIQVLEKLNKID